MRTEAEIREKLTVLRERLEADDWPEEEEGEPDWVDTSNRITALEWVLGIVDEGGDEGITL